MGIIIAIIMGLAALASQPSTDELFMQGAIEWSVPQAGDGFAGLVWVCDPAEAGIDADALDSRAIEQLRVAVMEGTFGGETCFAGLSDKSLGTGAIGAVLVTGP